VSPEHYGEYGVDNLQDLADVKLVLAQALGTQGNLVINADDAVLLARAQARLRVVRLALFALDYAHPALQNQREYGNACCGVQDGRLLLYYLDETSDLGAIADMPLTIDGTAHYNIANCAGAALAAAVSGIDIESIKTVLAQFGSSRHDNPGRLERWELPGVSVLLDYAHNPEGLHGLLSVAQGMQTLRGSGRLGLLLGQAGNRSNEAIADLAAMAAKFPLDHVILKDMLEYLRGRQAGEVPGLLQAQLIASGVDANKISTILLEVDAALALLRWAQTGDVLVLPVHDKISKMQLRSLLDRLQAQGWRCGQPLPELTDIKE
jgi:cyanophycin synthetase